MIILENLKRWPQTESLLSELNKPNFLPLSFFTLWSSTEEVGLSSLGILLHFWDIFPQNLKYCYLDKSTKSKSRLKSNSILQNKMKVAVIILVLVGCALVLAQCPHPRFVQKHLCTGGGVACGDNDADQEGRTGKTAARNRDRSLLCKGKPCPTNTVLLG